MSCCYCFEERIFLKYTTFKRLFIWICFEVFSCFTCTMTLLHHQSKILIRNTQAKIDSRVNKWFLTSCSALKILYLIICKLTFNVEIYWFTFNYCYIICSQAWIVSLIVALDVLDGQTVAWYDNSTIFVLIYRLSLQEWDGALFTIMVSVGLYLEYYLPTKLCQIAEDW